MGFYYTSSGFPPAAFALFITYWVLLHHFGSPPAERLILIRIICLRIFWISISCGLLLHLFIFSVIDFSSSSSGVGFLYTSFNYYGRKRGVLLHFFGFPTVCFSLFILRIGFFYTSSGFPYHMAFYYTSSFFLMMQPSFSISDVGFLYTSFNYYGRKRGVLLHLFKSPPAICFPFITY